MSLLDIVGAAAPRVVSTSIGDVPVTGISVRGLAILMRRFDVIRTALTGGEVPDFSIETLVELGPDVVDAIIAAGTGSPGDAAAEQVAGTLVIEDQVALIEAIVSATFPKGPKSFLERITAMAGQAHHLLPSSPLPAVSSAA